MWLELSVAADLAAIEAVSALFHQHGEGGVAIDQPFFTDPDGEHYGVDAARPATVLTYLPDTPEGEGRRRSIEEGLWHLGAFKLAEIGPLRVRRLDEQDWANAWKEHYHPLVIGRLVIRPSWRQVDTGPGTAVVELDPGMAFGTGTHQTTRMCLGALERLLRPGWIVIDQGTGSGILALAAARLGAREVWARDTAEVAVAAVTENAARNALQDLLHIHRVDAHADPLRQVILVPEQPPADLILANIIAAVLIRLAPALAAASKPGALLIASGIIRERAGEVGAVLIEHGYTIAERLAEDEWVTLIARLSTVDSSASS